MLPSGTQTKMLSNYQFSFLNQGILKGDCTVDLLLDWLGISCMTTDIFSFYLQTRLNQISQTAGQWYSDTSPFSIPWCASFQELGSTSR
jgi:hypothetical protein